MASEIPARRLGPYKLVAHCTFCGTSDLYCFPAHRSENERYFAIIGRPVPTDCQHFEETATRCPTCCGMQEDGHEFENEPGDGIRCIYCSDLPPADWHGYYHED